MLDGIVSYFPSRRPTRHEMETCDHVVAMRDVPWNPNSKKFERAEDAIDNSQAVEFKNGDRVGNKLFLSGLNSIDDVRRITP
mmetsp:Transcript_27018/g.74245  ORF Transcript_27018/g.74245 Transcript_27018/m.74245 type:complete len:82 (-) Transcript_27018:1944-2189(-)